MLLRGEWRTCRIFVRFKSLNSSEWLQRRGSDKYVELSRVENYRCRSAYKLLQIDEKYHILRPGLIAIDLGSAPGSWTQVLVRKVNSDGKSTNKRKGKVISVDRLVFQPIDGAIILPKADFTLESTRSRISDLLAGSSVDLVVSDMAPNASGVRSLDQEAIALLALQALQFAIQVSAVDATCLIKIWDGGYRSKIEEQIKKFYAKLNHVRPAATQTESTELFLLARCFKGLKNR